MPWPKDFVHCRAAVVLKVYAGVQVTEVAGWCGAHECGHYMPSALQRSCFFFIQSFAVLIQASPVRAHLKIV